MHMSSWTIQYYLSNLVIRVGLLVLYHVLVFEPGFIARTQYLV